MQQLSSSLSSMEQKDQSTYYVLTIVNSAKTNQKQNIKNKIQQQQQIRICTKYFNKDIKQLVKFSYQTEVMNQSIMDIYLYTQHDVYFSTLYAKNLNRQLNWNQKFFQLMKKSISGKNKNSILQFKSFSKPNLDTRGNTCKNSGLLKFYIELNESTIRLLLFECQFINIFQNPFEHSKNMLKLINQKNQKKLSELKVLNRMFENKIQKLQMASRHYIQQHQFEISHIKDKFLMIINDVKNKLRPHFGVEEKKQSSNEQERSQTSTRALYRITGPKGSSNRVSQNIFHLFD